MAFSHPEPAQPIEREKQHLPAKSYAQAVEEHSTSVDHSEGKIEGINGATNGANGISDLEGQAKKHTAAVLKITDTGAPRADSDAGDNEKQRQRSEVERQGSQREYTPNGLDDAPTNPRTNRQRKSGSSKSNESLRKDAQERSSNSSMSPASKTIKKEVRTDDQTVLHERLNGHANGGDMMSVKPKPSYEKQLYTDKAESKGAGPLVSGRKAGQNWEKSGIRFAPLNVPLQRRLQTSVILFHTLTIGILVSSFFFLCAIPLFWPLLIPYMIYCLTNKAATSGTLSHRLEFLRRSSFWSLFASYFPARLHRTQELPATRKYIFAYHPHGIISHGAFAAFGTEALGFSQLFPGITNTLLTLDSNFRIPLYRDYALALGVASVSKESCENLLSKGGPNNEGMGRAITIVIGGARESLLAKPYSMKLILKRRKGFVKLAMRTGADLVPVMAFGENDLYDQFNPEEYPKIHKFQLLLKKIFGFTIPLFHARGVFNYDVGLMPYRRPLNIVVGRPIMVVQSSEPKQEEIDKVHEEYVRELERLWETYKDDFAPHRESELELR